MIACVVDTETTGLVIGEARIIEIGCVLIDADTKSIVSTWSSLIYSKAYGPLDGLSMMQAFDINKIPRSILQRCGIDPEIAFMELNSYFEISDFIIAHNAIGFDKPLLEFEVKNFGLTLVDRPWVDSKCDIDWEASSNRLQHLASDYGIYTGQAHRALGDCMTLVELLRVSGKDLRQALEKSKIPLIDIVGEFPYESRDIAKARRFRWNPDKKIWFKTIRESELEKEQKVDGFVIKRML